jgi:hypothetical protein
VTPKPTRRPRKLLLTILLTLSLLLCALASLAASLLATGHRFDITFGSAHSRLHITSNTTIMSSDFDPSVPIGIGPLPDFKTCTRLDHSISIANLELVSYRCNP